ncbi:MAG: DEAD/DEAH box helicase [Deltaproteobacteria bacterium]|nr:DEAD/DEAH box helicase [Deltaproteobacteria bacterium]
MLVEDPEAGALDDAVAGRLRIAFARGAGHGILELAGALAAARLTPGLAYWRGLGARYLTAICGIADLATAKTAPAIAAPTDLEALIAAAPPMAGAEYLATSTLQTIWGDIAAAFAELLDEAGGAVGELLAARFAAWHLVGRVHFNLAENKADPELPFAFLATYSASLGATAKARHLPLGEALREYATPSQKPRLLSLLLPVQRAAESLPWLRAMVDAGEIFAPLRWSPAEAFQFLRDLPALEAAGVVVRVPAAWNGRRPARPIVTAQVGGRPPSLLGQSALLDFRTEVTLEGEALTQAEIDAILDGSDGLILLRGRWVEVDRDRLRAMIDELGVAARTAKDEGITLADAMRLLAGADLAGRGAAIARDVDWSKVVAGPWLAETLRGLRSPERIAAIDPGPALRATLRPYQQVGVRWLDLITQLGLGACLADDMGLGKTIQVLALLLARGRGDRPSLLVAPASLLGNWADEIARFAPGIRARIAHPSAMPAAELRALDRASFAETDLVITTYGTVARATWPAATPWDLVVLDEAQAIKNPGAKQTHAVKQLDARARIALTGTPVENRLGDLWSLFDFLNPGLLGNARQFTGFTKGLAERPGGYAPLRELVRPYILRRLKSDRAIIADLPDKTELKAYCPLSRTQAALYQRAVDELAKSLQKLEGIQRRGVVLGYLTRFKQICNHPSHWLGDNGWEPKDSGKLGRLRELAETIAARQEKALVFTQFREVTAPLAAFLGEVFGRPGLVLHGDTEVKRRKELVKQFQDDPAVPFFVLSLKAGGTGLNLTAASHVIHFDRWWNPAVENQATDRAFRIGQTRNVLVHKFVCRGTIEDKIDQMIDAKRALADGVLEGGADAILTELSDDALLRMVALDLNAAMGD